MKHTQGKVYIDSRIATTSIKSENGMDICLMVAGVKYLNLANAELIAEAFNVTNESGLTPLQLLEQRNELLDALNNMCGWKGYLSNHFYESNQIVKCDELENDYKKAQLAINNAQNK